MREGMPIGEIITVNEPEEKQSNTEASEFKDFGGVYTASDVRTFFETLNQNQKEQFFEKNKLKYKDEDAIYNAFTQRWGMKTAGNKFKDDSGREWTLVGYSSRGIIGRPAIIVHPQDSKIDTYLSIDNIKHIKDEWLDND